MIFQEDNQNWFEECRQFLAKDGRVLLVRVCLAGKEVRFSDVDHLLRFNGYRGRIISDDRYDTHMLLVNMYTMEMISVLNHLDYFTERCIGKQIIDFELFLTLHVHFKGRMRNRIITKDRVVTFDIPDNG